MKNFENIKNIYKENVFLLANNKEFSICGWLKSQRTYKKIGFLDIIDGSTTESLQIVYRNDLKNFNKLNNIPIYSSIKINGKLIKNSKTNTFEIDAKKIEILKKSTNSFLQKKETTLETLRDFTHVRFLTQTFQNTFQFVHYVKKYIQDYYNSNDFINIHSPIITNVDSEGAGEMFSIFSTKNKNFFNSEKNYLSVTGQLYAECFANGFKKVYTFAPIFRADISNTTKHVSEFWMVEAECSFYTFTQIINNVKDLLIYVTKKLLENNKDLIEFFSKKAEFNLANRYKKIIENNFLTISYTDAIEMINENLTDKSKSLKWGDSFSYEYEKMLTKINNDSIVILCNFPKENTAFYMKTCNDNEKTTLSFDFLFPDVGEVIGGSERESDIKVLEENIKNKNIDISNLKWYLDIRNYGYYKSAGYGLGFERLIMFLTKIKNIKDVIPFPRSYKTLIT